jgi:P27 family predicted phage terminase small subunit
MAGGRRLGSGRKPAAAGQRVHEGRDPHPVKLGGRPDIEDLAEPPPSLPRDAQEIWRRDVSKLVEVALVDRVDRGALEALCIAYARAKQAGRVVDADGIFVEGSRGQPAVHPAVKIEREAWDAYLRLADQYGMTPIARVRLGMAELGRRSLAAELSEKLGPMSLEVVEGSSEPA